MKKYNLFFVSVLIASVMLTSCDSDDGVSKDLENKNPLEERLIPVSTLSAGVSIDGAEKKTGAAPEPSGNVDFQLKTKEPEGFQNTGFDIIFSSSSDIAGAYIQLFDKDGNKVDGYFDVPNDSFEAGGRVGRDLHGRLHAEDDQLINVDFSEVIEPGAFCFDICLYDTQGAVSRIENVCLEVEAWGGNSEVVGEWIFDRDVFEEGQLDDVEDITCANETVLKDVPTVQKNKFDWTIVMETGGKYYQVFDRDEALIDFNATVANCEEVYFALQAQHVKFSGYWAYNEEKMTFTLVDFEEQDFLEPEFSEVYESGLVDLYQVTMEVSMNEMLITDTYDSDGTEIIEKMIFKKKQ